MKKESKIKVVSLKGKLKEIFEYHLVKPDIQSKVNVEIDKFVNNLLAEVKRLGTQNNWKGWGYIKLYADKLLGNRLVEET